MSRLSIEISEQQHQQIKAMAAISGLSIKDYIIEKTLSPEEEPYSPEELVALDRLNEFLAPRIEQAMRGEFSKLDISQIIEKAESMHNKKS
ncbi:MAG: hypothetical protein ABL867_03275 [Rickettsiales bacterium]